MSQEFANVPMMRSPIIEDKGEINHYKEEDAQFDLVDDAAFWAIYFKECEQYRDILKQIRVVVPVRPGDGMNVRLTQMLTVWYGEGTGWTPLNDHMGGFIEATRANIAYDFKHHQKEKFLLMIDNDMEPPVNLPLLLARHDKPLVGACCMAVMPEHGPALCFSIKDAEGNYRFPAMRYGENGQSMYIPARGLIEVGHVGTGALMIRRDVLDAFTFQREDCPFLVPQEARLRGMSKGFLEVGEDISFCNQVRAKGFPIMVDLEAHVGHRKTVSLRWDRDQRDPNMDASKWVLPCQGKVLYTK